MMWGCAGFDSLLEAKRLLDLATLYQLLSRIKGGLDELCTAFSNYIKVIAGCVYCMISVVLYYVSSVYIALSDLE